MSLRPHVLWGIERTLKLWYLKNLKITAIALFQKNSKGSLYLYNEYLVKSVSRVTTVSHIIMSQSKKHLLTNFKVEIYILVNEKTPSDIQIYRYSKCKTR